MGALLNDWIKLFDEENFCNLHDEPQCLRAITMLFVTIQKEFKKVEIALSSKIQTYKVSFESECIGNFKTDRADDIISIPSSPEKNLVRKGESSLKSPTFDRHRKVNLRKNMKPLGPHNTSAVFSRKDKLFTPNQKNHSSKVILAASDEDDLFDSTVICETPNVDISKKMRNTINSQRNKRPAKPQSSTTLTQLFNEMICENDNKRDETTMMDIDEILANVEKAERIDVVSGENSGKNLEYKDSFIEDYDKIPEPKGKTPKRAFVYKETVRGKKKQKLKGWSCKECEKFYEGMELSHEELEKKMNECSKHRSRFKPDDETIPGYWDLTIPSTQEDENSTPPVTPEGSPNNLNESSIYCFFKK